MAALRPVLPKLALPLAVFASVLGLLWFVNRPSSVVAPDTGADLGAPGGSTGERIADLQRAVRDDPGDAGLFSMLGDAYLEEARQSGDPSFYARAERSFDAALRRDPGEVTALVGAGALANARHDFRRGLRLGLEARRLAPELVRPLTVVADAQVELGRYAAAANTVQRMLDLKPTLAAYARASYLRELTGDLRGAIEAMRLAVSAGAGAAGDQAYVATLLGDLELQRGRIQAARGAYRQALASQPSYVPAAVGLARVDAAQGSLRDAERRLRQATARLPLTSSLTLLAEVDLVAGRRSAARRDLQVVRAQQRLVRAAGLLPDAELVLFEANHGDPAAAVRLARRVWRAAPSVRSADALGWALTRSGRPSAGLRWARRALALGSADPLLHFHAGLSAKAAGRFARARRELRLALRRGAALPPVARRDAKVALEGLR